MKCAVGVGVLVALVAPALADLGIWYLPSATPGVPRTRFYGCDDPTCALSDALGEAECLAVATGCYTTMPGLPVAVFATAVPVGGAPESSPSNVWIVGQANPTTTSLPPPPTTSTTGPPLPTTSTTVAVPSTMVEQT